ncbi:MAG: iron-containing alcohol dehydrogenase, partial [Alphaproteobacteria bacterium]
MTNMPLKGNWNYPTSIRFGAGRLSELGEACAQAGMANPLLVTDPGLAALPLVTDAVRAVEWAGLAVKVFSAIKGNPTLENVEAGVAAFKAGAHDGVIAFGGGSALDA